MRLASFCRARAESDHSGSYPADPESSNFTFGLHVNLKQQLPTDASSGIKSSINRQFSPRDVRSLIRSKEKSSICNIFWPAPPANWYQLVSCLTFLCTHIRSEEHTSELQSLMRISYAVFCLKKKIRHNNTHT